MTYTTEQLLTIWEQIKAGGNVKITSEWHDAAIAYFNEHDGPDADRFFRDLRTSPNPNRVGTKDLWIASLT